MRDILKLAIVMFLISACAGLAIALVNKQTLPKRLEQALSAQQQAIEAVFPQGTVIEQVAPSGKIDFTYWIGKNGGKTAGYAFKGASQGYSSSIQFIVGVSPDGSILGVSILSQNETPGLGTRVGEVLSKKYFWNGLFAASDAETPWFTRQFKGLSLKKPIAIQKEGEWHTLTPENRAVMLENNAISALTGATISTRAVSSGVYKTALESFQAVLSVSGGSFNGTAPNGNENGEMEDTSTAYSINFPDVQ